MRVKCGRLRLGRKRLSSVTGRFGEDPLSDDARQSCGHKLNQLLLHKLKAVWYIQTNQPLSLEMRFHLAF